ncbi:2,5-didehydrogluconate reductase DkgB [Gilvimarinus agarilyticus]|uniref:2,5-didehydrogluconate reductase DkgB n=1 Tax=Gilvimarinus agarilyticus TaxID=679259 RepID=UPI0005A1BF24|nr:2,5-didehydrogluconate reductase DkgB [Gilvimarinus agarilyticus]
MSVSIALPQPGLGTFRLQDDVVIASVKSALELGYRHIDTAAMYDNEAAVGRAISESQIPREEIFVTTKIWFDRLSGEGVIAALRESLAKLDMDYVDLALIHWPSPDNEVPMAEYLAALDKAREMGLTRAIGVSNFTIAQIDEALSLPAGKHIATNQIEVHPLLANSKLVQHCQAKGIQVTGYMPLAVGKVMDESVIQNIAAQHNASAAQVALAWVASKGITVIPSSTKADHQKANLDALDLTLTAEEVAQIDQLDRGERVANPPFSPVWDQ